MIHSIRAIKDKEGNHLIPMGWRWLEPNEVLLSDDLWVCIDEWIPTDRYGYRAGIDKTYIRKES